MTEFADLIRGMAGQLEPPYSLDAILEFAFPGAIVTGRDLPFGIDEIVTVTCDGALIIYRRDLSTSERRFAIAHAMAHLLFDLTPGQTGVPPFDPAMEARADEFALELLAPSMRAVVDVGACASRDDYLDLVDLLAAKFHVPSSGIDQRIRGLTINAAKSS